MTVAGTHTFRPMPARRGQHPLDGCPAEIISGPVPSLILHGASIFQVRITGPDGTVVRGVYDNELDPNPTHHSEQEQAA